MPNDPARAEFWKDFVVSRCGYPDPGLLWTQLSDAHFSEFCDCGCNSFAVKVPPGVPRIAHSGNGHHAFYTADFKLADERTLEIILFANDAGHLDYIEVDCCANSYPVPDVIDAAIEPFHTWAADGNPH